ncbi:hypothetical protein EVG20_g10606 [Dentipellis fragilis]|uniref:Rho-GAP domain-containing protein n=1 Tax=Dentipellis fragilis TaxID=205917 RepID=A0A4Y9XSC6_9AGAM|nr:hypothetical protein EVG20_g10606 [Dentipellis fragilis]
MRAWLTAGVLRVDQFMSLSLAAESRRKGLYEPYFWTKASSSAPTTHTLVPLLFTEPLPVVALVNRAEVWRGRLESGANRLDLQDVQALRRQAAGLRPSDPNRRHSLSGAANLNPIDMGGTVLPLWDGELLLLIQPPSEASPSRPSSRAPSRPTSTIMDTAPGERPVSRAPSIRVKPGSSQGLERKASLARRNSLPSISARASLVIPEHPSERPVRVVVKAGTLDRLVEVLAHGLPGVSVSIADDNGEMPLREGKTRDVKLTGRISRNLISAYFQMLADLFAMQLLRKRYVSALLSGFNTANELRDIARIRSDIFETITEWLQNGNGSQDILDDAALFQAVQAFLTSTTDHEAPDSPAKDDPGVVKAWNNLAQSREAVLVLFTAHTMRPPIQSLSVSEPLPSVSETPSFTGEPPDLDKISPEDLVDNFDAMACAAFRNVTEEDLFITSDLLEVQSADRMGWFLPRDASATSDDVEIQTIYTHITEVQPSPMISELTQDELFRLLPPGLRSCIRAHLVLRKWLVSRLVAPRLGLQVRQARMDLLLRAIEVCRRRSEGNADDSGFSVERPAVPSFVEVVLTSAILSVESRLHQRAWTTVASSRKVPCDSLAGFLARPQCRPSTAKWPLTTDMGWTLERMLEIISLADVLDPSTTEGRTLVNFDKRRHLCSLIDGTPAASSIHRSRRRRAIDRRDFERLNNIEREVSAIHFDLRSIRDDAYKEGAPSGGPMTPKRNQRPFQKLISAQQEKNKRDRWLRDRLGKERKQEQQRHDRRDEYLTKAMHTRRPYSAAQRQHRMKKSGSSSFFQNLMRPISSAFALDVDANTVKRTAAELDFTPSGKPTLVLSVVDARVSPFVNHYRSYTFQLDTEDGGHYLLQAVSRREMMKWIQTIDRVSKTAAKRRLTYLGNSPKPQLADHIHDRPTTASRDPTAVFGVDLEFLLKRESGGNEIPHGAVPQFVERSLSEVESRGLSEVGIYRIAGASSEVNGLKEALNRGEWPITENSDIYAVCDLIKAWFRVLPEPVFPSFSYHDMIDAMKIDDFNPRLERIRTVVQALPRHNFDLLKRVVEHLDKVTDYEEHNQMGSDALAIVFSPNLLRAPHNDFVMIMANMSYTNKLVKALITHFHTIFDDEDIDAEADQEDDFDEPIPEEDEEPETEFTGPSPIGYPASENDSDPRIASENS